MTTQVFVQNQTKEKMKFAVTNENDGSAIDLTDATITLKVTEHTRTTTKFSGTCTITDAVNGLCEYPFADADLDTVGSYVGELYILFVDTKKGIIHGFNLKVVKAAP